MYKKSVNICNSNNINCFGRENIRFIFYSFFNIYQKESISIDLDFEQVCVACYLFSIK